MKRFPGLRLVALTVALTVLGGIMGCASSTPMRVCSSSEFRTSCTHYEVIQ